MTLAVVTFAFVDGHLELGQIFIDNRLALLSELVEVNIEGV